MGILIATLAVTIVGGVVVALVVPRLDNRIAKVGQWFTKQEAAAEKAKAIMAKSSDDELRARVAEVAKAKRIVLAISATGSRPTIVKFSDGGVSFFYGDFALYKRMQNGPSRTDVQRSFSGNFTGRPVGRWSRAELAAWLEEHDR